MRTVFADTVYWVAFLHRRDRWHPVAQALARDLRDARLVTTQEVLGEVLTYFAGYGAAMRTSVVRSVLRFETHPQTLVLPQTPESFRAGVAFYEARPDKEYSLPDCISMHVMRERGITEVLTHDHHFAQEGFVLLMRDP